MGYGQFSDKSNTTFTLVYLLRIRYKSTDYKACMKSELDLKKLDSCSSDWLIPWLVFQDPSSG